MEEQKAPEEQLQAPTVASGQAPEELSSTEVKEATTPAEQTPQIPDNDSDDDDDDEDDEDVIEESPCGRYSKKETKKQKDSMNKVQICCRNNKRREVVKYRDVPGIDTAYLAMDTEEGVEVVWNEAVFSGSKKFKSKQEDKLKNVFEALTLIDHPNIVKFHR